MSNVDQDADSFGAPLGPDDLERSLADDGQAAVVDGLTGVLAVCAELRQRRLAGGLDVGDVAARCSCDAEAIAWVDEGDVAAPVEALVYYAAALGLSVRMTVG